MYSKSWYVVSLNSGLKPNCHQSSITRTPRLPVSENVSGFPRFSRRRMDPNQNREEWGWGSSANFLFFYINHVGGRVEYQNAVGFFFVDKVPAKPFQWGLRRHNARCSFFCYTKIFDKLSFSVRLSRRSVGCSRTIDSARSCKKYYV